MPSLPEEDRAVGLQHVPKRRKSKPAQRRRSLELFHWNDLPDYLKDNEFIFSGYRADTGVKGSLKSLFKLHNESGNVWTHLIGFGFFIFLLVAIVRRPPTPLALHVEDVEHAWEVLVERLQNSTHSLMRSMPKLPFDLQHSPNTSGILLGLTSNLNRIGDEFRHLTVDSVYDHVDAWLHGALHERVSWPVARWPFYVFMGGAMSCLLLSATCHLLGCCNRHISETIWRFDYAGIIANIVSSFYPAVYYVFLCHPAPRTIYLLGCTLFGGLTLVLCLGDRFQSTAWRPTRALCFACLGLFGVVPWAHAILQFIHIETIRRVLVIDALMGASYLTGAVFYATRVPERFFPGKFDLLFHSHQIFHLFVVLGAYVHYVGVTELLHWRDASGGCALEVTEGSAILEAAGDAAVHLDFDTLLTLMRGRLRDVWDLYRHGDAAPDAVSAAGCSGSDLLCATDVRESACAWMR